MVRRWSQLRCSLLVSDKTPMPERKLCPTSFFHIDREEFARRSPTKHPGGSHLLRFALSFGAVENLGRPFRQSKVAHLAEVLKPALLIFLLRDSEPQLGLEVAA